MTETFTTPTEPTNTSDAPENPVDDQGKPIEPTDTDSSNQGGETVESLKKALNDTKAELTRLQQGNTETDGKGSSEPTEEGSGDTEGEGTETQADLQIQEAEKVAEEAGVDFTKYSEEYNTNGELSEDAYKELASKGFDKQIVDDYIEGQKARNERQTQEVSTVVGGIDNLQPVLEWAGENLSPEEIQLYNEATSKGTAATKLALEGVYARYTAANGEAPNLLQGGTTGTTSDVFKSSFEMTKAMEDDRYWNDPDYRQDIVSKIERSHKAGTI